MGLTIKEIIDNALDEMRRAREIIGYFSERLGEPIGDGLAVTDAEILICDMNESIERLATIENTILVALNAAVYAGNIETSGEGFVNDFGADSLSHRAEYLAFAEQYDLPYQDDGLIATDCVYDDVSKYMWERYATEEEKETENYRKFKETLANTISAEALEEYAMGNPDDLMRINATDVIKKIATNKVCPKCGNLLYLSDLPQYDYVCTCCDENFYECEVK